jgi:hypothetical protein
VGTTSTGPKLGTPRGTPAQALETGSIGPGQPSSSPRDTPQPGAGKAAAGAGASLARRIGLGLGFGFGTGAGKTQFAPQPHSPRATAGAAASLPPSSAAATAGRGVRINSRRPGAAGAAAPVMMDLSQLLDQAEAATDKVLARGDHPL